VKFVIADIGDWEYAQKIIHRFDLERSCKAVLISPVWNYSDLVALAELVASSGLNVRLQLQLHKYIWGAEARGV
jgi:7-carboxy-7-deazaguanine synthase